MDTNDTFIIKRNKNPRILTLIPTITSLGPEFYHLTNRVLLYISAPWSGTSCSNPSCPHCGPQLFWALPLSRTAWLKWIQWFPVIGSLKVKHFHLTLYTLNSSYLSYMWHDISNMNSLFQPHWSPHSSQFRATRPCPTYEPFSQVTAHCPLLTPVSSTVLKKAAWSLTSTLPVFWIPRASNICTQTLLRDSVSIAEAGIVCKFNKHSLIRFWSFRRRSPCPHWVHVLLEEIDGKQTIAWSRWPCALWQAHTKASDMGLWDSDDPKAEKTTKEQSNVKGIKCVAYLSLLQPNLPFFSLIKTWWWIWDILRSCPT